MNLSFFKKIIVGIFVIAFALSGCTEKDETGDTSIVDEGGSLEIEGEEFLAIVDLRNNRIYKSNSELTDWKKIDLSYVTPRTLIKGGDKFVLIGGKCCFSSQGDIIVYSSDIISWSSVSGHNGNSEPYLLDIVYGDGKFITVGYAGAIYKSNDGIIWTDNSYLNTDRSGVSYGLGIFLTAGNKGEILYSSDGGSWLAANTGVSEDLREIAYGNNMFIAVGEDKRILKSSDGITWKAVGGTYTSNANKDIWSITYGGKYFVGVGGDAGNGYIIYSVDGDNWNEYSYSCFTEMWCRGFEITYSNSYYYIAADQEVYRTKDPTDFSKFELLKNDSTARFSQAEIFLE